MFDFLQLNQGNQRDRRGKGARTGGFSQFLSSRYVGGTIPGFYSEFHDVGTRTVSLVDLGGNRISVLNSEKTLELRSKMRYNSITKTSNAISDCSFSGTDRRLGLEGIWSRSMDITKMLDELRQERESIEEAIITLERLARGRGKRRGRPPAWLAEMRKQKPAAPKRIAAAV